MRAASAGSSAALQSHSDPIIIYDYIIYCVYRLFVYCRPPRLVRYRPFHSRKKKERKKTLRVRLPTPLPYTVIKYIVIFFTALLAKGQSAQNNSHSIRARSRSPRPTIHDLWIRFFLRPRRQYVLYCTRSRGKRPIWTRDLLFTCISDMYSWDKLSFK